MENEYKSRGDKLMELVEEFADDDSIIFPDEAYKEAVIGVTIDGEVVYDYDKMLVGLMKHEGMTVDEAADWLSYNTIRALTYIDGKSR